jgi:hypothetical protein
VGAGLPSGPRALRETRRSLTAGVTTAARTNARGRGL